VRLYFSKPECHYAIPLPGLLLLLKVKHTGTARRGLQALFVALLIRLLIINNINNYHAIQYLSNILVWVTILIIKLFLNHRELFDFDIVFR
jgi:hypothetical protein